ncbi:30S ribosomal protein S6--L-glutamate ligase [Halovulum sp. GXIMD14793]
MRIALMCRNAELYSHRRLVEAAESRGHDIQIINHMRCYIDIASDRPALIYEGERLTGFDAVIPRIGASVTHFGTAVLRQFEMMGVYALNESVAISRSRDKLRSLQLLSRRSVGMPATVFAHRSSDPSALLDIIGGAPAIIKLLEGTQGKGVVLGESKKTAESIIQAFSALNAQFIVQSFVKEANGEDIRCIVIGDRVVASMKRKGAEDDFRSNLHQGGSAEPVKITPKERATAVKAAKVMGLNFCGVDMLRATDGPAVMEVNSSPGLEGVERATQTDVAGRVIAYLEKVARPHGNRTRGKG